MAFEELTAHWDNTGAPSTLGDRGSGFPTKNNLVNHVYSVGKDLLCG